MFENTTTTTTTKEEEEEEEELEEDFFLPRLYRRHASTPVQLRSGEEEEEEEEGDVDDGFRQQHLEDSSSDDDEEEEDTRWSEKTSRTRPRRKETRKRRTKEVKMEGALQRVFFKDRKCGDRKTTKAPLGEGGRPEEMEYDASAYDCLHAFSHEWPSLSFDILKDDMGDERTQFPHAFFMVSGTQADRANKKQLASISRVGRLKKTGGDKGEEKR